MSVVSDFIKGVKSFKTEQRRIAARETTPSDPPQNTATDLKIWGGIILAIFVIFKGIGLYRDHQAALANAVEARYEMRHPNYVTLKSALDVTEWANITLNPHNDSYPTSPVDAAMRSLPEEKAPACKAAIDSYESAYHRRWYEADAANLDITLEETARICFADANALCTEYPKMKYCDALIEPALVTTYASGIIKGNDRPHRPDTAVFTDDTKCSSLPPPSDILVMKKGDAAYKAAVYFGAMIFRSEAREVGSATPKFQITKPLLIDMWAAFVKTCGDYPDATFLAASNAVYAFEDRQH